MFRIGIAEDDPSFQKTISEYIERYKKEKEIDSNRESGFGRYDIMLIPRPQRKGRLPAVVLEFKVYNEKRKKILRIL